MGGRPGLEKSIAVGVTIFTRGREYLQEFRTNSDPLDCTGLLERVSFLFSAPRWSNSLRRHGGSKGRTIRPVMYGGYWVCLVLKGTAL